MDLSVPTDTALIPILIFGISMLYQLVKVEKDMFVVKGYYLENINKRFIASYPINLKSGLIKKKKIPCR